jgi:ABC-type glycerol-3-phosphate transport system substrate-binding protein
MDLMKPLSRRRLLAGAAAVGVASATDTLLTPRARASTRSKDVVTLSFWTNPANTEEDPEFLQVVKNFEATQPNIKVK